MKKHLFPLTIITFLFFSCSPESSTEEETEVKDTVSTEMPDVNEANDFITDSTEVKVYQEEVDENQSLEEALKSSKTEPQEEGGMSFCDCVKKNKELEQRLMEEEDDTEIDKIMSEMEAMKTGPCKIMFPNQTSKADLEEHQRKVRRCLGK